MNAPTMPSTKKVRVKLLRTKVMAASIMRKKLLVQARDDNGGAFVYDAAAYD